MKGSTLFQFFQSSFLSSTSGMLMAEAFGNINNESKYWLGVAQATGAGLGELVALIGYIYAWNSACRDAPARDVEAARPLVNQ